MRTFLVALTGVFTLCLAATPALADMSQEDAAELNKEVDSTLSSLYKEAGGSKDLVDDAKGVLVFPSVTKAGLVAGAEYGKGVLRIGGKAVDFYSTKALSVGLQAGAQSKSVVLVFTDQKALDDFQSSRGWEAGVDGNIAILEAGTGTQIDTASIKDPIVGFVFGNKGLMADISLKGSKFSKLDMEG